MREGMLHIGVLYESDEWSAHAYKAIVSGTLYGIRGAWCDECGNCHNACPTGAVVEK